MDTSVSIALITAFSTLTATGIGALFTYKWEFRKQKLAWKREERKSNLEPVRICLDELAMVITSYNQELRNLITVADIEMLNGEEKQQISDLKSDSIDKISNLATKSALACCRAGDILLVNIISDEVYNTAFELMHLQASIERTSQEYTKTLSAVLFSISKAYKRLEELATEL